MAVEGRLLEPRTFREMHGENGGDTDPDDRFARRSMEGFGAFILGRNMFGPIRGEWPVNREHPIRRRGVAAHSQHAAVAAVRSRKCKTFLMAAQPQRAALSCRSRNRRDGPFAEVCSEYPRWQKQQSDPQGLA